MPEAEPYIFHGVVRVDVQIPFAAQAQIKTAPEGDQGQHVVEHAEARDDCRAAFAVQCKGKRNASLSRAAGNFRSPGRGR